MLPAHVGGSFAPPLTDDKLAAYQALADALPANSRTKDALAKLLTCCGKWWQLPESKGTEARRHPSGRGLIVPLEKQHAEALWEHIPWDDELEAMGALFDTIDPIMNKPLRDAAFHLLWHAKELSLDREPLTSDQL